MESVLALWHVSAVSSDAVCTIFWWAAKAGLRRDVPRLALRPGGRSGNYKRHLDTCLGHAKRRQLHNLLPVPGHKRHDLARTVHDVPTMPMHEVLAKELPDSATVPFKLEEARENGTLAPCLLGPPSFEGVQHPCVASGGFHGRRRLQPHRQRAGRVGDQHDQPEAPPRCPDSQEADVPVRVPGMVFPVPSDDPASLVPGGHGGWQVCVGASRHFWPIFFEGLSWENNVEGCVRLISSRSPNTPIAATMVPTGGAMTSSVRRRVARAWA